MRRLAQGGVALALALGAHVAAFAAMPKGGAETAAEAAGEGGASLISLAPAPDDLAELIKAWETPPKDLPDPVAPQVPVADAAPALTATPDLPALEAPGSVALPAPDPAPKADKPPETPMVKAEPPAPEPKAEKPAPEPKAENPEPEPKAKKPEPEPKAEKPEAEKPKPKDPASPAQKAKGKGKGAAAGEEGTQAAGALSAGQVKSLTADWGAKIAARIERAKRYPAKANGATGRVVISLTVAPSGELRGAKVKKSSGNPVLDAAALATVKAAGRFAKAPKGVPETRMSVTLRFEAP